MALTTHRYPRVDIMTTALRHTNLGPEPADTTVLFVPFVSPYGPNDKIVRIHSLSEFIITYGELNYNDLGQTALNIYQWLRAGGTIYGYRLKGSGTAAKNSEYGIDSKYIGAWYNDITVTITSRNPKPEPVEVEEGAEPAKDDKTVYNTKFDVVIRHKETDNKKTVLLSAFNLSLDNLIAALDKYGYKATKNTLKAKLDEITEKAAVDIKLDDGIDALGKKQKNGETTQSFDSLLKEFWKEGGEAYSLLGSKLETPIDVIIDAGYSRDIKNELKDFVKVRDDIFLFLDRYELIDSGASGVDELESTANDDPDLNYHNIALYDQYFRILDETFTDREVCVCPSYFLSYLIPYNDINYGVQYPTAGLRRGILSDALWINENPTPDHKDELFGERINYVEKTSREYAFMSQRTYDGSTDDDYTALSFINNTRTLFRMKREIERLARNYLFEFNDSATLTNMSMVLNKYITEWVSNRTLSEAEVTVAQNPVSEEAVDVTLNIKFTGTIEVISVSITIE